MASVVRTVLCFTNFAGRRRDGKMIKGIVPQFDGSTYASGNCAGSSEAVRDIAMNQGTKPEGTPWPPTGASIRAGTGDTQGGMLPSETTAVSRRRYGYDSDIRIVDWNTVIAKLTARFSVTLLIRYAPLSNAGHSGSPGFMGNHSIHLLGIRWWNDGGIQILVSDSLCDGRRDGIPEGPYWLDISVLKSAAAGLDLGNGLTLFEQYGSNKAYCSFATIAFKPAPEPPQVVIRYGAHAVTPKRLICLYDRTIIRSTPRRIATNHVFVVPKGNIFNAYQRVDNTQGSWMGDKSGKLWVMRSGYKFGGNL